MVPLERSYFQHSQFIQKKKEKGKAMSECPATLIWVHRSMRPQKGTFASRDPEIGELHRTEHKTLSEAVDLATATQVVKSFGLLPWIHAWGAGGAAIFDIVEIEAIKRTIDALRSLPSP